MITHNDMDSFSILNTILYLCENNQPKKINAILNNIPNIKTEEISLYMFKAIETNNNTIFNILLDYSKKTNKNIINRQNNKGETLLYKAVFKNNKHIVEKLLKEDGININIKTYDKGYSPLLPAIYFKYNEILKLLLQNSNIDINIQDNNNHTPIMLACWVNNKRAIKLLANRDDLKVDKILLNFTLFKQIIKNKINKRK